MGTRGGEDMGRGTQGGEDTGRGGHGRSVG